METKPSFLKMNTYKASFICMLLSFACLFLPWKTFTTEMANGGEWDGKAYASFDELAEDDTIFYRYLMEDASRPSFLIKGEIRPQITEEADVDALLSLYELPFNEAEYLERFRYQLKTAKRGYVSLMGLPAFRRNRQELATLSGLDKSGHLCVDTGSDENNTYYTSRRYSEGLRLLTKELYILIGTFVFSLFLYYRRFHLAILPYTVNTLWFLSRWMKDVDNDIQGMGLKGIVHFFVRYWDNPDPVTVHAFYILALIGLFLQMRFLVSPAAKEARERKEEDADRSWKRYVPVAAVLLVWGTLFVIYRNTAQMKNDVRVIEREGIYYVIHGKEASVAGLHLSPNVTSLTIPSEVEGVPVVSILSLQGQREFHFGMAFYDNHNEIIFDKEDIVHLEQLVLPDSIRTIWAHGLCSNCVTVDEVVFGDGLQWIASMCDDKHDHQLFSTAARLELPASLRYLSKSAFSYCNIRSVRFQGNLIHEIPEETFCYCTNLETVDLPEDVTHINRKAFLHCKALTEVRGPGALEGIYDTAFKDCTSLRRLDGFDKDKTGYNESAFEGTTFLE